MKISCRWLQEYIDCADIATPELAECLTMAGLEVEGIEERSYRPSPLIVVGEVLDVHKHENASELYVCQVDVAGERALTIVCGASNVVEHAKVVVALEGAVLPDGLIIRPTKLRGILSEGMLCAEDELGIGEDHSGILLLSQNAPIGQPVSNEILGIEDDTVLEIGLTPNRGDCSSHIGIAREIATLFNRPLNIPAIDYPETGADIAEIASVTIESPENCHRYTASVISGVKIGPSPSWLKQRLESVGVRSINNVVDVTNFVMLEFGQPLHSFDLDEITGRKILVRQAEEGEMFTTLDGVERQLDQNVLMIADEQRDIAIAGVMGGLNSEISETTTNILLESAYFDPSSVRRTSKKLGLSTEASYRFERVVDLDSADTAVRRATKLIYELAGGTVASGIIDCFPRPHSPTTVSLRTARVQAILGISIAPETIQTLLRSLGFRILRATPQETEVEVPSYRPDVIREIDLIEEVGRIHGYDKIPTVLPSGEIPPKLETRERDIQNQIRESLMSQGLSEAINYSFFDEKSLEKLFLDGTAPYNQVVRLRNPLGIEQGVLRTTTIPGLLSNVRLNMSNRQKNLGLFEVGRVFFQNDQSSDRLPDEKNVASAVFSGTRQEMGWAHTQESVDFYDSKGVLENIFAALNVACEFRPTADIAFLHPGEAAAIFLQDEQIGVVGKLHPDVLEAFDLDDEQIYLFELFLQPLAEHAQLRKGFTSLPKFPAVHRDLAIVLPSLSIPATDIEAVIREEGAPLLESVMLFDRYVGPQIGAGQTSFTYSLRYRSSEKTLTDDEVSTVHQRIIDQLQNRLGIRLR